MADLVIDPELQLLARHRLPSLLLSAKASSTTKTYSSAWKLWNGTFLLQDLPPADVATKIGLRDVMKKAYLAGKKPVFRSSHLYINGQK